MVEQGELFSKTLTSSVVGSRVKISQLREIVEAWQENNHSFGINFIAYLKSCVPSIVWSKMSLVYSPPTKEGTWKLYSKGWKTWATSGNTEYLTLNILESPNAAVESSLSDILETDVSPKYYLSAKACRGILRRAEKRGKDLPESLEIALQEVVKQEASSGKPPHSKQ
tara:strand:- start:338 stop:841 length:504 start_codon:yes stop_codon:yes gene_type:complete